MCVQEAPCRCRCTARVGQPPAAGTTARPSAPHRPSCGARTLGLAQVLPTPRNQAPNRLPSNKQRPADPGGSLRAWEAEQRGRPGLEIFDPAGWAQGRRRRRGPLQGARVGPNCPAAVAVQLTRGRTLLHALARVGGRPARTRSCSKSLVRAPGGLSGWASAWSPGCDPRVTEPPRLPYYPFF